MTLDDYLLCAGGSGSEAGDGKDEKESICDGVGSITEEQLRRIAETKMPDLDATSVETAMRVVAGTARSGLPPVRPTL